MPAVVDPSTPATTRLIPSQRAPGGVTSGQPATRAVACRRPATRSLRLPATLRSLRHRNYRAWALADLVSVTGSWMQVVAQGWLVLTLSHSALALGLTLTLQAAPSLLLGMAGGAFVDRVANRRRLLVVTQALHGLLGALLAVLAATGHVQVWTVYALGLAGGLVGVVDGPALGAFSQELVGREDLPNAMALGSMTNSAGRILGMSSAGAVIAVLGLPAVFALNAATFLAVIAALLRIDASALHPLRRAPRAAAGVRAGLRYVAGQRQLVMVLLLAFFLSSFGRNFQVTMAAMSAGPLEAGAGGYSVCSTAFAVGALAGAVLAARLARMSLRVLLWAAAATGLLQGLSSLSPGLAPFAAVMVPVAAGAVVIDTAVGAHVALSTAEEMRGRVLAVQGLVGSAAGAVGGPLLGWLASTEGPRAALLDGGTVVLLATLVLGSLMLRRAMRLPAAPALGALVLGRVRADVA